jgi:transcriptional regulator with GAF, ATPase, and Fis domain
MDVPRPPTDHHDDPDDLGQLNRLLLGTESFEAFLTEFASYAQAQTQHTCSVTVRNGHREPYTVVATDELTLRLDERQYHDDRGPCLEALRSGIPVLVTDMTTETRWAPYPSQAAQLGARSSMSYPLITGEQVIGALNLYAFKALAPDVALQARAAQLADRAAGALAVGLRIAEEHTENANLRIALNSRSVIDQAIGILIAQQQCSVQDAFALLRQASQGRNIKLREVATQIVASAQRRASGKPGGRRY